jgi:hypothetical protein
MSRLRVNKISNSGGDGSVTFSKGLTLPENKTLNVELVDVVGVATASAFVGDGNAVTNLPGISVARAITNAIIT